MEPAAQSAPSGKASDAHPADASGHVTPLWLLLGTWGALVALTVLTVLTVAAIQIDLGAFNIWVAMGIATLKGLLVALVFMHLLYDRPFHSFIFMTALVFVFLFIGIALMDTSTYNPDLIPHYAPGIRP